MSQHVVIRRSNYVAGTYEKPEVGVFTQTHSSRPPVPWNQISIGETVWMKWSGGPIVAKAKVEGFRQIENCTPEKLHCAVHGFKLYDLIEYWEHLQTVFWGMVIYLRVEQWLDEIIESNARSYGSSWVVLNSPDLEMQWLISTPTKDTKSDLNNQKTKRRSRTIGDRLRFEVFRRDNFTCQYCGRKAPDVVLQVDHIIPWSKGGSNSIENLITACQDCNLGKSDKSL